MTIHVLVVPVDPAEPVRVEEIDSHAYEAMVFFVGGDLEAFSADGWSGYCDEEGKIKGLPINTRATRLAYQNGWLTSDVLCGPVVFCGDVDDEGYDTDVPTTLIEQARRP